MPSPSRVLTNDYNDCKLIKLDFDDPKSPLVVLQEAYAPSDPVSRMRVFYLQHDGFWIDEIARSTLPEREIGEIVFDTPAEALRVFSGLFGKPLIRDLPVTENDVRAYMARAGSGSPKELFREFLARYRASKSKV
ncbi:MAG: hypothetical protein JWL59_4943 [Chthoniobacteraceae bacterium]|nr:hypothetical protein [Chthoniobacteraceae bacterium]